MNPRQPTIIATASDVGTNIFEIRIGHPMRFLQSRGEIHLKIRSLHELSSLDLLSCDILILQRDITNKYAEGLIEKAFKLGIVVVFEIDDLLTAPPPFLPIYAARHEQAPKVRDILSRADFISVSTARLGRMLNCTPDRTFITPNYATPPKMQSTQGRHDPKSPVHLIFASSDSVQVDFMLPAISEVLATQKNSVKLVVIGALAQKFKEAIPTCQAHNTLPLHEFKKTLTTLTNPIGLIPLDDSAFSSCKSAVKYFEYALSGIPTICSNVPPYSDVITSSKNGVLIPNTKDDWITAINDLIRDHQKRTDLTQAAEAMVRDEFSLMANGSKWMQLIRAAQSLRTTKVAQHKDVMHQMRHAQLILKAVLWEHALSRIRQLNRNRKKWLRVSQTT